MRLPVPISSRRSRAYRRHAARCILMFDELVAHCLLGVSCPSLKLRHAVDHVVYQVKAIHIVHHHMSNGVVVVPSSL